MARKEDFVIAEYSNHFIKRNIIFNDIKFTIMLPFTVKYTSKLSKPISNSRNLNTLAFVRKVLLLLKANITYATDSELRYKGSSKMFVSNWDITTSIDRGTFKIEEKDGQIIIVYEIVLNNTVIFATIFSFISYLATQTIWARIMCLLWLGGMNLMISCFRHKSLFVRLIEHLKKERLNNNHRL
jgi:hypothetical protein